MTVHLPPDSTVCGNMTREEFHDILVAARNFLAIAIERMNKYGIEHDPTKPDPRRLRDICDQMIQNLEAIDDDSGPRTKYM